VRPSRRRYACAGVPVAATRPVFSGPVLFSTLSLPLVISQISLRYFIGASYQTYNRRAILKALPDGTTLLHRASACRCIPMGMGKRGRLRLRGWRRSDGRVPCGCAARGRAQCVRRQRGRCDCRVVGRTGLAATQMLPDRPMAGCACRERKKAIDSFFPTSITSFSSNGGTPQQSTW
jgi:hypothetical protein